MDSTTANSPWIDSPVWTERWVPVERLIGGGQGEAFRAKRVSDGQIAFLKTIKSRRDAERRARFFREASAYESFAVNGIPRLLESNAHLHKNAEYRPFIATTFVEGPTLRKWREDTSNVDLTTAVAITTGLLRILRDCHSAGCVHRDIKPDNIILADSRPERPSLLDFGLSYHQFPEVEFETEHWQEIGNRFLRLPELSAGSNLKQDPRSDVTFAGAVLYYILTARHPDVLQDAEGRLPHQRGDVPSLLQEVAGVRFRRLVAVFDEAFEPRLVNRFADVSAMARAVENLMSDKEIERTPDADLAAILAVMNTAAERRHVAAKSNFREGLQQVQKVFDAVTQELGEAFERSQTGFNVTNEYGINTLFWSRRGSGDRVLTVAYEVRESGDELIIRIAGSTIYRTSFAEPDWGPTFRGAMRAWLLAELRSAVFDPSPRPPEAEHFKEIRPLLNLDSAAAESRDSGHPIITFAYEPSLPERGRLDHALRYFLQNQKTRRTLMDAFVIALAPAEKIKKISSILDGLSMENARWIIFDSDLNAVEQDVVHANPQEAERIADQLVQRHHGDVIPNIGISLTELARELDAHSNVTAEDNARLQELPTTPQQTTYMVVPANLALFARERLARLPGNLLVSTYPEVEGEVAFSLTYPVSYEEGLSYGRRLSQIARRLGGKRELPPKFEHKR